MTDTNVIDMFAHPIAQVRDGSQKHVSKKRSKKDRTRVPVLSIELFIRFTALQTIKPISYLRLAEPWEKATRMMCSRGYVEEFF